MHTNILLTFLCIYSTLINASKQEINGQKIYKNKVHYEKLQDKPKLMPLCTPLPRETANMEHENKNKQAIVTGVQRTLYVT